MSNDDQPVERRQARAGTFQVSRTAFGFLATLLAMAIGGLVKSQWDQHSAATRFESQIKYLIERLEQETGTSRAERARNEVRIQALERSTQTHDRQAERIIGEWGFQLKDHERRIRTLEKQCDVLRGNNR